MDLVFAGLQGLGLALGTGALLGAPGRRDSLGTVLLVAAVLLGAFLFGLALSLEEDHPMWPGWPVGALAAVLAFLAARDVSAGASSRPGGGAGAVAGIVVVAALVTAGLAWLLPPVAAIAALAVIWLLVSRRRRAGRKHEGLRTLR